MNTGDSSLTAFTLFSFLSELTIWGWATLEQVVDEEDDVSNRDITVAVGISGLKWIGRRAVFEEEVKKINDVSNIH